MIQDNLKKIKETISKHVDPANITIVAAAKFQSIDTLKEAFKAGLTEFGVNYVQEGEKFQAELKDLAIRWHFIGHIQSRKVKQLIPYQLIQSMDRMELVEELNKRAGNQAKEILIEVNIGEEPQKSGILPKALPEFLAMARKLPSIKVVGLMAMPPNLEPVEKRQPYFDSMHDLFIQSGFDSKNHFLSMGTSEDYEIAVKAGSNMIRLGTCLLGKRPTS